MTSSCEQECKDYMRSNVLDLWSIGQLQAQNNYLELVFRLVSARPFELQSESYTKQLILPKSGLLIGTKYYKKAYKVVRYIEYTPIIMYTVCAVLYDLPIFFRMNLRALEKWCDYLNAEKPHLTHWSRVTHIYVSTLTIIGSDICLSPGRHQAIIWTNAGILLIGPL